MSEKYMYTSGAKDAVWIHDNPYEDRPHFDQLKQDAETDVCVVGASVAGISTAYELVIRGEDVILLDARDVLAGESGRTSAHLSNALDDHYVNIQQKHGFHGAMVAADSHTWALDRVGEIAKKLNIDCNYHHVPAYEISQHKRGTNSHAKDMSHLREEADTAKNVGLDAEFRDGLTIRGWDGSIDQRGGTVFANQASFHPTKYLSGILKALQEKHNFRCFARTRVLNIEEVGRGILGGPARMVKVQTEAGHTIQCSDAVEATNMPLQKPSIIEQLEINRTYAIAIRIPKGSVEDCFIYDSTPQYKYVRLTSCDENDDYMIVGGCDHQVGRDSAAGRFKELEGWVRDRFTRAGTVDYAWSGQINEPIDYMAFIGKNQGCENVYIATGDSGNGLTHGVLAGRLIADEIDGKENPWTALYSPKRCSSIAKSLPSLVGNAIIQINS